MNATASQKKVDETTNSTTEGGQANPQCYYQQRRWSLPKLETTSDAIIKRIFGNLIAVPTTICVE